jgi:NTP pyrophosphatase (non-canonical NTP hydrolase)
MMRDTILEEVAAEMRRASDRHGELTSTHEGYGVLAEEVAELLDAIRANALASVEMEAIQVAAVAARLAWQCRRSVLKDTPFSLRSVK